MKKKSIFDGKFQHPNERMGLKTHIFMLVKENKSKSAWRMFHMICRKREKEEEKE